MADKWIMIVEDDVYIEKAYRAKFAHEQIVAETVGDGEAALAMLRARGDDLPSLILLDMMLPKKNGFEVLTELKANPKWKSIPVIILSNLGQESDAQKGLALGAVEYLVKADTKINTIVEKVRRYLR
jgi:DNA-binding response OmpR family regulator